VAKEKEKVGTALPPATKLANYTIVRRLRRSATAITYEAREAVTGRTVAVKECFPAQAVQRRADNSIEAPGKSDRERLERDLKRFRREAKLLMEVRHANVAVALNYIEANGTAYLVTLFEEGRTLTRILRGSRVLPELEVRRLLDGLLAGLEKVHAVGLLHRGIKPDNIILRDDGTPVLVDFGAARPMPRAEESITAIVTDGYSPLEQYSRSGDQGPWTDLYALASVAFEALTGRAPADAPSRAAALVKGKPDPMARDFARLTERGPAGMVRAIIEALAVDETARPQSAADFRAKLGGAGGVVYAIKR
jgi:serine/threonine protein kinase